MPPDEAAGAKAGAAADDAAGAAAGAAAAGALGLSLSDNFFSPAIIISLLFLILNNTHLKDRFSLARKK